MSYTNTLTPCPSLNSYLLTSIVSQTEIERALVGEGEGEIDKLIERERDQGQGGEKLSNRTV